MWWRCAVVVVLLGVTTVLASPRPPAAGGSSGPPLYAMPWSIGTWTATDGAPEAVLPVDPNAVTAVRRTFTRGADVAWMSAASFERPDDPARRAQVNLLLPQRGATRIEHVPFAVALAGTAATPVTAVIVHRGDSSLGVLYWYQVGTRAYGGEYGYRAALLLDLLMRRPGESTLVRLATPLGAAEPPERALARLAERAPTLGEALRGGGRS